MRFVIIIAVYNMADWIGENIRILKNQTYKNFRCILGDDLSTDHSVDAILSTIDGDDRFSLIKHTAKKYSLGNICTLIEQAQADDNDVIVLIDGDDRLSDEFALDKVARTYVEEKCWMTYGSYSGGDDVPDSICKPYTKKVIANNSFRSTKWRASHLKTFKYKLWAKVYPDALTITQAELNKAKLRALLSVKWRTWANWRHIKLGDLLDENRQFTRRCSDKAITSPLLELAGEKAVFIPDILYYYRVYEKDLKFNASKNKQKWYQRIIRDIIMHKKRYSRITEL